ncbi:MAG: acyl-CoA dehydrogenase, partial [Cytophagaceae bacterium]
QTVGRYQLRGAKTFASGAGQVSRALLTAALPDKKGWQMLLLPTDQQAPTLDRRFWQPLGMRATASFRAQFDGLELGYQDLIGQANDYYQQPWFGGGATRFAAVQLGGAAAVLDETRRFLRRQQRTDDPFQRQRLGEMLTLHEAGQQWLRGAAEHAALPAAAGTEPVAPARQAAIGAYANLVRTATEEICLTTLRLAERSVGARGLLQPEPFERLHRDLTHYLRQPAPDAALADAGRFALASDKPAYQLFQVPAGK